MAPRGRALTLAEFAQQLIEYALSPEIVDDLVARLLPPDQQITIAGDSPIAIAVRPAVGAMQLMPSADPDRELRFDAPLGAELAMAIDLLVGKEQYSAVMAMHLKLIARPYDHLTIVLDYEPVDADEIMITTKGQDNWFDIIKRLGLLDGAVRQAIAAAINTGLAANETLRTIEVAPLVRRTAPTVVGEAVDQQMSKAGLAPAGEEIRDALETGDGVRPVI